MTGAVWIELDALFAKLGGSPHCRPCFLRLGSGCTFPSPILTDVVGAGLHTVCLDRMHVLDLGALSSWSGAVVSELLKAGTFGTKDKSFGALSAVLRRWLRRRRSSTWIKQVREKNLTGGAQKPFLKFRTSGASKMRAMLPFLLRTLSGKRLALDAAGRPGTALYRAGLRYNAIYALMRRAKARRLTTEEEQQLARHAVASQRHWAAAGGHMYPKNHFLVHMAETIVKQGPVATWTDAAESFNRIVKKMKPKAPVASLEALALVLRGQPAFADADKLKKLVKEPTALVREAAAVAWFEGAADRAEAFRALMAEPPLALRCRVLEAIASCLEERESVIIAQLTTAVTEIKIIRPRGNWFHRCDRKTRSSAGGDERGGDSGLTDTGIGTGDEQAMLHF